MLLMVFNSLSIAIANEEQGQEENIVPETEDETERKADIESEYEVEADDEIVNTGFGAIASNFEFTDSLSETNNAVQSRIAYPSSYTSNHTSTKMQGDTNLCWAFATISNFETAIITQKSKNYDLSEEHAVQCIKGKDTPEYRIQNAQNTAGNFDYVWNYLTRGKYNGAIEETTSLPFNNSSYKTLDELDAYDRVPYYPTQYIAISDELADDDKVNKIKEVIYQNGGVTAMLDQNTNYYNGAYYYHPGTSMRFPHLIEIIGWDDSIEASKFNSGVTKNGAFIAKNSLRAGLTYLSYESVRNYKEIKGITEVRERSFFDYQYENYELPCARMSSNNKVFLVNKYTRKGSGYEELDSVNVFLNDTATKFNVYVSPTGKFEDLAKVELSNCQGGGNGTYATYNAGEFVVDLKEPMLLRSKDFLVGIELYNPNKMLNMLLK